MSHTGVAMEQGERIRTLEREREGYILKQKAWEEANELRAYTSQSTSGGDGAS